MGTGEARAPTSDAAALVGVSSPSAIAELIEEAITQLAERRWMQFWRPCVRSARIIR